MRCIRCFLLLSFWINILECDLQSPHVIMTESKSTYRLYGKPRNSGVNSNGTVHPGGNFPEEPNLWRYCLLPVFTETTEFSVPFVWITSARVHVERKRKIYRYFVNNTTQSRSCSRKHLTEIFHRNFRTNGKRSKRVLHSGFYAMDWTPRSGFRIAIVSGIPNSLR